MTTPIHILSTRMFSAEWLAKLQAAAPGVDVRQHSVDQDGDVPPDLWRWAEVVYTWGAFPDPALYPNVRWVQLDTAGYDAALASPLGRSDVAITTLIGVAPPNMAEHTLMMMLALGHNLPDMFRHQMRSEWPTFDYRWTHFTPSELGGATVGIVGYGSIGKEIGRIAHAFGMRVIAITPAHGPDRVQPLLYHIPRLAGLPGTEPDLTYTPERLLEALPQIDYLVLSVPHTPATHHMLGVDAFAAMKRSAFLINVARGGVVDEAALIDALRTGKIAGAALDVFEQEPLPAESPLWTLDNVIISPHAAGFTSRYYDVVLDLFSTNIRRYMAGEPLLNQVWPKQ